MTQHVQHIPAPRRSLNRPVPSPTFIRVGALIWTDEGVPASVWLCERCVSLTTDTDGHEAAGCGRTA